MTYDPDFDLTIPAMGTFRTLERAQALGDFESLDTRGRRGARLHLASPVEASLAALGEAIDDALSAKVS
jgi:hypothetical protein